MKYFYWLVKLTDWRKEPPVHHAWRTAFHPKDGPFSTTYVGLLLLREIREAGFDDEQIRGADWQLVWLDEEGVVE